MKNGILAVAHTSTGISYDLRPHTPLFFNDYILPYEYNPNLENNVFLDYLNQILSPDEIVFLRQWFGYCLVPVTIAEKFLLMQGEGANGKSVVLLVLNLLLGEENVSHVHLQGFYSQAAFDASDTVGKLCNTVQEIDKVKDVATGFLKEYTSGERMRANEKFKAAYDFVPTARLVFACNHLPGFKDDSDAFNRRLIILQFKKQFLKKNANKTFKKRSFWLSPGVLTSVFNWALGGLSELVTNEWEFHEPSSMADSHNEYKVNASPELEFLKDNLEMSKGGEVSIGKLYDEYKKYCTRFGFNREDKNVFGRLIRKVFPLAIHSGNQLTRNGKKDYHWKGVKLINEPKSIYLDFDVNPETQQTQQTQESLDSGVQPLTIMDSVINLEEVLRAEAKTH